MSLSAERRKEIKRDAEDLLLASGKGEAMPIDTAAIARHLGFEVRGFEPNAKTEAISGAVDHRGKTIYINADEPTVRQHFTLAHEIGHVRLHAGETAVDFRDSLMVPRNDREREANLFAAELLMPTEVFFRTWIEQEGEIKWVARVFGVAEEAVKIRAREYQLI